MGEVMKKISVIVPVYNVKKYLPECIKSIVEQTYKNLEIIIVDDGSTDGSGDLCDELAETDERIRVVHQENKGISAARNYGKSIAAGEYISFVDSDDIISPVLFEKLEAMMSDSVDIGICFERTWQDGEEFPGFVISESKSVIVEKRDEYLNHFMEAFTGRVSWVWNKLYRAELIKKIDFKGIRTMEDLIFNAEVAIKVRSVAWTKDRLYGYRIRREGLTDGGNAKMWLDYAKAMEYEAGLFAGCSKALGEAFKKYAINEIADKYYRTVRMKQKEEAKEILKRFRRDYDEWNHDGKAGSSRTKLLRYCPFAYCSLKNLMELKSLRK